MNAGVEKVEKKENIERVKITVPFPVELYNSWKTACNMNNLNVEEWCKKQLVERLKVLQSDDPYMWNTFFAKTYYSAVIAFEKSSQKERSNCEYSQEKGGISKSNRETNLDQPLYYRAIELWEKWMNEDVKKEVEYVNLTVPMDTSFRSVLRSLAMTISRTAEDLCSILVISVIIELINDRSFFLTGSS
ncbi:MAG: hypothetical protein ACFFD4_26350 [Candidatus Odinarchaeota archaeon]